MNVNRKVLFGAVVLFVLLISFIQIYRMDLQTSVGAEVTVTYACYFPSVVDNNNDKKAWIEIMNIAPVASKKVIFYIKYINPNETLVKATSVSLSQFGRVRLRVWNQVGGRPFDGQVFIYSSYEFVAEHTQWWKIGTDWEAWSVLQRSAPAPIIPFV